MVKWKNKITNGKYSITENQKLYKINWNKRRLRIVKWKYWNIIRLKNSLIEDIKIVEY